MDRRSLWYLAYVVALMLVSWTAGVEAHRWYIYRYIEDLLAIFMLAILAIALFLYLVLHPRNVESNPVERPHSRTKR
jgi:hypothetical protein